MHTKSNRGEFVFISVNIYKKVSRISMFNGIPDIFPSGEYLRLSDLFAEETNKKYQNKELCPTKRNLL